MLHRVEGGTAIDDLLEQIGAEHPEALEHERVLQVDHREDARRDVAHGVADRAPQVPLRLRILRPFARAERVGVLQLRRAPHFALQDIEVRRIALHQPTQRYRQLRVGGVRVRVVGMVDEAGGKVEGVLLLQLFKYAFVVFRRESNRRAEDLGRRLDLPDSLRRAVEHLGIFLSLPERLVPDFPFVHHILVPRHACLAVANPGLERLRLVRHLLHAHPETEVAAPYGVAIRKADPRLHAHRRHLAHLRVEPREIVPSLLLLGLRPAGEEPPTLGADHSDVGLELVPVRVVAIHRLAADRPLRAGDLLRGTRLKDAGRLESAIELAQLLPRDASFLLLRDGLLVVVPGIPALDLRGILERNDLCPGGKHPRAHRSGGTAEQNRDSGAHLHHNFPRLTFFA